MNQGELDRALAETAFEGTVEQLRALISLGADVNTTHTDTSALENAIDAHNLENVRHLVNAGANINQANGYDGSTPLIVAAHRGQTDIAEFLLNNGAEIEATDGGWHTALAGAAASGHLKMVVLLINRGADVNGKHIHQDSPLHRASYSGHFEVAKFLLAKGASVEGGQSGITPLHCAASGGHIALAALLLDNRAGLNTRDYFGRTPLAMAREQSQALIAEYLHKRGAVE
ncbi:MAG TPA: ankyrin repeat domain-containing protein [Capsulimonadaceae bacterium]|jgi:ankyrin repeat protein